MRVRLGLRVVGGGGEARGWDDEGNECTTNCFLGGGRVVMQIVVFVLV